MYLFRAYVDDSKGDMKLAIEGFYGVSVDASSHPSSD